MNVGNLRVGNLIQTEGGVKEVQGITIEREGSKVIFTKVFVDNFKYYHIEGIRSIILTEEWILKFGFVEHEVGKFIKRLASFNLYYSLNYPFLIIQKVGTTKINEIMVICEKVDELQNIFYFVTREELTLNQDK